MKAALLVGGTLVMGLGILAYADPEWVPENFGAPVNTASNETQVALTHSGRSLYIVTNRTGGQGLNDIWVSRRPAREDFERDITMEARVARAIHLAHAARPDERDDFIWSKSCARSDWHVCERALYGRGAPERRGKTHEILGSPSGPLDDTPVSSASSRWLTTFGPSRE